MIFRETPLPGAYIIEVDRRVDARGFFARIWCSDEFSTHGLKTDLVQCNLSWSERRGTLRGMHYQTEPFRETKLVRCVRGAIFDAIIDLRTDSSTFKQWFGVELTAESRAAIYVPEGFAHGVQTLTDDTEIVYFVTAPYSAEHESGVRWNDPTFGIEWPVRDAIVSEKDAQIPDFRE